MSHNIFVVGIDGNVRTMFQERGWSISSSLKDADAICFTGGADISPFLYGQKAHRTTDPNLNRDMEEVALWKAVRPDLPKLGICRGMQLGNVLCGGTLWQDVDNHSSYTTHDVVMTDRRGDVKRTVNTLHHQMVRPTIEAIPIAIADRATYKADCHQTVKRGSFEDQEVEALYYWNFNFLGVQWHPEYDHKPSTELFFELIDEYIQFGGKKKNAINS